MLLLMPRTLCACVVPRKGDVDRNHPRIIPCLNCPTVVPRKGDVDRNLAIKDKAAAAVGRPPQGGRG